MSRNSYDTWPVLRDFVLTKFTEEQLKEESDFVAYLRWSDYEPDNVTVRRIELAYDRWLVSKSKGNWEAKFRRKRDRERRASFGPGRFHAASSSGVFLNKNFVKGWGGINPVRPAGGVSAK
jgi:hypothetical protein